MRAEPTTNWLVNLGICLFAVVVLFIADWAFQDRYEFTVAVIPLFTIAILIGLYDTQILRVHERPSAGLKQFSGGAFHWKRIGVKVFAFYATIAIIAVAYWVVPWLYTASMKYVIGPTLDPVWRSLFDARFDTNILIWPQPLYDIPEFTGFFYLVERYLPVILVLAIPYTAILDRRLAEPHDSRWHVGQMLLGRFEGRDWGAIRTYVMGWVVKAFFLPLMIRAYLSVTNSLISPDWTEAFFSSGPAFYFFLFKMVLFVDLCIAVLGYLVTSRFLDTHIRSVNPLSWGWAVTLVCYYPFWFVLWNNFLRYSDGQNWQDWFSDNTLVLVCWGAAIMVFKIGWMVANTTFGLRFSNLTHRGILTAGPFALTKHPSYVCKNIGWWLINVPFLSQAGWSEAAMNCVCMLGLNLIYWLRAQAEERHLSEDPAYVAYALRMNRQSIFAWRHRLLPWLAYRAPDGHTLAPKTV